MSKDKGHSQTYSSRFFTQETPKHSIPESSMPANAAYQLVHDECFMDANPELNLSSFCTTWMEPEAEKIIMENLKKNFIDYTMYPQTKEIQDRCVSMLAELFHIPPNSNPIGAATIGSSEAIMLAGLAHKTSWKNKRKQENKPYDKPNIVFGADVQVCWEKFAKYFDVEMRIIPMDKKRYVLDTQLVKDAIDENTICVGAILGTTFTGESDPIEEINHLLLSIKKEKGWDIPLHIDGASGAFVTAFTRPKFKWDFRLEQVKSINTSGHKYGLVYPGIGWLIFKDIHDYPEELIFYVNYLGGKIPTMTLNFSRGSSMVLAQYYNFLRLGKEGYRKIMNNCLENARYLAKKLLNLGVFEELNVDQLMPIVTVRLKPSVKNYTVFQISDLLRQRGWVLSAYTLPPNAEEIAILRVVVREQLSRDMIDILLNDIAQTCKTLGQGTLPPSEGQEGKHIIC